MSRTCRKILGLSVIVALVLGTDWRVSAQSSSLTLAQLETNGARQPLGIDDRAPRFTWRLNSNLRGILQTSFRLVVASKPDLVNERNADIWDSGRVPSADPFLVYGGPALKSRTRYFGHWRRASRR